MSRKSVISLIGAIALILLPLFCLTISLGMGLSGGFKCPISWMLVLTSTFSATWILGYYLERKSMWNLPITLITIVLLLAIVALGLALGEATAGLGLLRSDASFIC
jgi:hypothetical protein